MANPIVFVENFLSITQFPLHTRADGALGAVDAVTYALVLDEPVGFEPWRTADGRRNALDYWTPVATNTGMYLRVICDQIRSANMIALDRTHNLAGKGLLVRYSSDNFVADNHIAFDGSAGLPSVSAAGSVDDPVGVRTEEGAWIVRFPTVSARYWRIDIQPMGASLRPKIGGIWLGLSWEIASPSYFAMPWSEDAHDLVRKMNESDTGWRGFSAGTRRRQFAITLKLGDFATYDLARYHINGHFGAGRPMWIINDYARADRSILAIRDGKIEFQFQTGWGYRQATIPWIEHESALP